MDWIVILLLGLGGGVVGAILKRIFKLSERVALIISMSISILFVIIYIDNTMTLIPKQNYTTIQYNHFLLPAVFYQHKIHFQKFHCL